MAISIIRNENPKVKLIYLSGTWEEIGESYGQYLKRWYKNSPMRTFSKLIDILVEHSTLERPKVVKTALRQFIYRYVEKNAMKNLTEEAKIVLRSISKTSGIPENELLKAFSFADVFPTILYVSSKLTGMVYPHALAGCSSFVAGKGFTKDNNQIHGRNFDFFGGDEWDNNHAIIVIKPKNKLGTITIAADSTLIPGVTTLNEAGLVTDLHINYTKELSRKGNNILGIVLKIASEAKNFDDIEQILLKYKRISGWGLITSHPKLGARVFEITAKRHTSFSLEEGNYIYYNNTYHTEELKKTEYSPAFVWDLFNIGRDKRMKQLLPPQKGKLDIESAAKILGDHYDPWLEKERGTGSVISCVYNTSSVIFDQENDRIFMALGEKPLNNNSYHEIKISDLWEGKLTIGKKVEPYNFPENRLKALRHYIKGYNNWWYKTDLCTALQELNKSVELDPEESQYLLLRCWIKVKTDDYDGAREDIDKFLTMELTDYRREIGELWSGRVYDLQDNGEKARKIFKKLKKSKYKDISKWASKFINKPYTDDLAHRMDIDFVLGEFFDY